MSVNQYREAGLKVFGLWEILPDGRCGCGRDDCDAAGKHPRASNWQHTPDWSDEQFETFEELGHFSTGFGVVVQGLLVIDVDERNGGVQSYAQLVEDFPEVAGSGFIVRTGSEGGKSHHFYFSVPEGLSLLQSLPQYPGIDFKTSGYVVGAGSQHKSGGRYEAVYGTPADIEPAPEALLEALRRPEYRRVVADGISYDVSEAELVDMLQHIENADLDYESYIRVGMALHHATGGAGQHLWDDWSAQSTKFDQATNDRKWHSFGKSANPATVGTLIHFAEQGGWVRPVTFSPTVDFDLPEPAESGIDIAGVDLKRPPGFVGKIAEWINQRSRYPRESLSVAAALATVSSVAGMRHSDPLDGITPNMFLFGVAGSATGKEAILKAHTELLRVAGVAAAVHGAIKSEQEIYRNLTRHQAALYVIDELGEVLSKIQNARKKGTSAYLEGVIGTLLAVYSKASGFALITGDLKEEIRKNLAAERKSLEERKNANESSNGDDMRLEQVENQLKNLDSGLERPYLGLFGLTTPERFGALMDFDMATNGFMGRALIFTEREDNPKSRGRDHAVEKNVPDWMAAQLQLLYNGGDTRLTGRVECVGDMVAVSTKKEAQEMLDLVEQEFWALAEQSKHDTGLTAIPRRGYEQVAKVSMILAMADGVRTAEHVRWAYALVLRDVREKMELANSNSAVDKEDALVSAVLSSLSKDVPATSGIIRRKCRKFRKEDVDTALRNLIERGKVREEIPPPKVGSGRPQATRYYLTT